MALIHTVIFATGAYADYYEQEIISYDTPEAAEDHAAKINEALGGKWRQHRSPADPDAFKLWCDCSIDYTGGAAHVKTITLRGGGARPLNRR